MLDTVRWYGHATIRIEDSSTSIVIDPYTMKDKRPADIILITHAHYDHLSDADLDKIRSPSSIIVAPTDCCDRLGPKTKAVAPGQQLVLSDAISVETYPAYNLTKKFHPKENGWVGYVIVVGGRRYYVAGDTDRIPEMNDIRCDVAFLPVGGTYTMNADEAA